MSLRVLSQTAKKLFCPICGGAKASKKYQSIEDLEYAAYKPVDFVACADCGIIRQEPLPPAEAIASFYPANYRNYRPVKRDFLVFLKDLQAAGFAGRIGKQIGGDRSKKILDIGFGNGQLLLALARQGYKNLFGSDFNSRDCFHLEEKGITVGFSNVEEEFPFPDSFDCIVMNNVIEHFLDPIRVIQNCFEHLVPGGRLIMVTPNANALDREIFGRFWAGFHAPRHTFLFGKKSFEIIASTTGFSSVVCEPFADPGQLAISVQNVFQAASFVRCDLNFGLAWYSVPLSILSAPLALLQNLAGRSTALIVVMEKEEFRQ